ncbi:hypothetical protein DFO77_10920 [Marinilabilia salmonicolor]|jgi:hypothetical protein|uniref:Uncharacterized protein n=1 Tax=Marinilabilia salmonicolor TaxID=989 RepID=A0A2T0XT37_9BACT|nr:hypothetical protein BY457_101122 [Marinilabilia salmonicolor]RCW36056.1 hypothetical protein DFO77_10920 [Marinilabilia salmonicolor]
MNVVLYYNTLLSFFKDLKVKPDVLIKFRISMLYDFSNL